MKGQMKRLFNEHANKFLFLFLIGSLFFSQGVNSKSVPYIGNPVVENCVACKFIWENIEEALVDSSNSFLEPEGRRNPILASQAFQYFCRIAPDVYFEPCNIMFEKLFFMTEDFCAKKSVKEICENNDMCAK
jgi:hypothetical protein